MSVFTLHYYPGLHAWDNNVFQIWDTESEEQDTSEDPILACLAGLLCAWFKSRTCLILKSTASYQEFK